MALSMSTIRKTGKSNRYCTAAFSSTNLPLTLKRNTKFSPSCSKLLLNGFKTVAEEKVKIKTLL